MHLRYWAGFVSFSLLLHAVFLWPLPDPPMQGSNASPLMVSLPGAVFPSPTSEIKPAGIETTHTEKPVRDGVTGKSRATEIPPPINKQKNASKNVRQFTKESPDRFLEVRSKLVEAADVGVTEIATDDLRPSISSYRLALAAEAIRTHAWIEKLIESDFKGRVIVLVQLREAGMQPQVSLEQGAGFEPLDREVLNAFKRAAEVVPISMAGDVKNVTLLLPVHFEQPPRE